jgi:hypothetical protein
MKNEDAHTQPCGIGSEIEEDKYGRSVETILVKGQVIS